MEALTAAEIGMWYAQGLFTDDEICAMLAESAADREASRG